MFLVGVLRDRPWAYQIGMLLFAALIIHNILLFYGKGMVLRLAVMLAINSVGFLLAVISLESYEERKWRMQESMPPPPKPPPKVETFEQKTVPKAEKKPARKKRKK